MIEDWPRIREVFQCALELPEPERRGFVAREACGNVQIETEVLRLLGHAHADDPFLFPPRVSEVLTALAPVPSVSVGEEVGGYRVERLLGSGGMGSVYAARQRRPDRVVALKVMGSALEADAVRRFEVEAEILARLRHPGIAAIFELGFHARPDGAQLAFFAMELVEGARDLVRHAREEALDQKARLELFREVCAAVHHAHQRGVIHRDLKPGNLLVDSSGRAKVIDYGVARVLEPGVAQGVETQAGRLLGTLQYISPEQLAGDPDGADMRSDVYALGVILYELVADRLPYEVEGKSITEVVAEVCERTPPPPSTHRPELAPEVDWIVLKALSKERSQRYDSAAALAEDLARFARDEPVLAGPETQLYRARKFVRRHRVVVAAGLLALGSLVGGTVATGLALVRARDAQAAEASEAERARTALRRQVGLVKTMEQTLGQTVQDVRRLAPGSIGERLGQEPATRAALLEVLANIFDDLGQPGQAHATREAALAILGVAPEPDLELRGRLKTELARFSMTAADLDQAEAHLEESLDDLEQAGKLDGEAALYARRMEAELLVKRGRNEEARDAYRATLEDAEESLGPDHALTMRLLSELGMLMSRLGRLAEAEELTREAYERAQALLGPDHSFTLQKASRYGLVLTERGELDEVVPLQQRAVAGLTAFYGESHRNVPIAMYALATAQLATGDAAAGEETAARAHDLALTHHPDDVELEMYVSKVLIEALIQLGLEEEATALLEDNLTRMLEGGLAEHARLADVRATLGRRYLQAGRPQDAEHQLRAALELGRRTYPAGHVRLLATRGWLGSTLLALERPQEAEAELRPAYDGLRATSSIPWSQEQAQELIPDLVAAYEALGREEERTRFEALLRSQ